MLESLDTLIAFVVIISVASLVVTVVVQTLSAMFTLRGRQLTRGLRNAGDTFFPVVSKELAKALLRVPNFLGIPRSAGAMRPDEIYERLKKLATVSKEQFDAAEKAAQAARKAATDAKANAGMVDADTAQAIETKMKAQQEEVKRLSPRGNAADATVDEKNALKKAIESLDHLNQARTAETAALRLEADLALLKVHCGGNGLAEADKASSLAKEAAELLAKLTPDPQKAAAVGEVLGGLVKTLNVTCFSSAERQTLNNAIQSASRQLVQTVDSTQAAVEAWFNDAVDRAQQWFLSWVRVITVVVAAVLSFVFQWDAVEIFQKVSGPNNVLRDALVAKSAIVLEKGDGILKVSEVGGGLLERLQTKWNMNAKPDLKLASLGGVKKVQEMEEKIVALVKDDESAAKAALAAEAAQKTPPGPAATDLEIANKKAEMTEARKQKVRQEFDAMLAVETKVYFDSQQEAIASLAKEVSLNGFDFIPKGNVRWKEGRRSHISGMLIFMALLSLGAPFWFNLLKNLSDLRPALAKLLDPEAKPPAAPAK